MLRTRFLAVVLFATTLAGYWWSEEVAGRLETTPLEGTWMITSVHREGIFDPGRFGSYLTFAGHHVTFRTALYSIIHLDPEVNSPGTTDDAGLGLEPIRNLELSAVY